MEENVAILKPKSLDSLLETVSEIQKDFDGSKSVPAQQDEESPKECNYFAESQQNRIDSMIRNGMEPEEAISKESERYAQLVAQWTMDDTAVKSSSISCISTSLDDTTKEITKELNDKADSEEEKSTKNLNNFTGGQIKRIVAMIKCGIEPEKARDLEQERYDKFAAQKQDNVSSETLNQTGIELQHEDDDSVAKESSTDEKPKQEKFTSGQKRRIAAMIKDGIQPETARKFERIRYARLQAQSLEKGDEITSGSKRPSSPNNSLMQPEFKKPRHQSEMLTADKKPASLPTSLQSRVNYYHYELAIIHTRDPEITLTLQEIYTIKVALLNEMDKSNCSNIHHQFVENFIKAGWWSVTCQNIETKAWIMSTVPQLKLWPNASIKVVNTPNLYRCVTVLSAEDFMPKHLFLSRIQKQNFDLKTGKWRIINVEKNYDNGETITFSVDEQSKDGILKQGQKLWLNFSQIYVKIEPRLLTRKWN